MNQVLALCKKIEILFKNVKTSDRSIYSPCDLDVSEHIIFRQTARNGIQEYIAASDKDRRIIKQLKSEGQASQHYQHLRAGMTESLQESKQSTILTPTAQQNDQVVQSNQTEKKDFSTPILLHVDEKFDRIKADAKKLDVKLEGSTPLERALNLFSNERNNLTFFQEPSFAEKQFVAKLKSKGNDLKKLIDETIKNQVAKGLEDEHFVKKLLTLQMNLFPEVATTKQLSTKQNKKSGG